MTTETTERAPAAAVIPQPLGGGDVIAAYESMLEQVPDAGGDGLEGILATIASSTSADELDAAWQVSGLSRWVDQPIVVESIAKLEAQYDESPIPYYLVVHGYQAGTGAPLTATTGSVGVVAQLVKAFHLGAFPLACIVREKESRTRKGAMIQHLEMVR